MWVPVVADGHGYVGPLVIRHWLVLVLRDLHWTVIYLVSCLCGAEAAHDRCVPQWQVPVPLLLHDEPAIPSMSCC